MTKVIAGETSMATTNIKNAIIEVEKYCQSKTGPEPDICATAVVESGLMCRIQSPDGKEVKTDMSEFVGGSATANSPGWLSRAAIASCDATLLAIRAAREGIKLDKIEVKVDASSDGRGMFLDVGISPASSEVRILFNISAKDVSREQVQELVDWVVAHSPVGNDLSRAVDVFVELETT
jgi:uncharacterized OsmC-like protein